MDELTRKMHLASSLEHISRPTSVQTQGDTQLLQHRPMQIPPRLRKKIEAARIRAKTQNISTLTDVESHPLSEQDSLDKEKPTSTNDKNNDSSKTTISLDEMSDNNDNNRTKQGNNALGNHSPLISKAKKIIEERRHRRDGSGSFPSTPSGDSSLSPSGSPSRPNNKSKTLDTIPTTHLEEKNINRTSNQEKASMLRAQELLLAAASKLQEENCAPRRSPSSSQLDSAVSEVSSSAYLPNRITRRSVQDRVSVFDRDIAPQNDGNFTRGKRVTQSAHGAEIIKYGSV